MKQWLSEGKKVPGSSNGMNMGVDSSEVNGCMLGLRLKQGRGTRRVISQRGLVMGSLGLNKCWACCDLG